MGEGEVEVNLCAKRIQKVLSLLKVDSASVVIQDFPIVLIPPK